jgi:hemerythrin superfamily protein
MKTAYSTDINHWPQFSDTNQIKKRELSKTARKLIFEKEKNLGRKCGKIFLDKNINEEVYIFARMNKGRGDYIISTIAAYVPIVGFVTQ